jgi:hypothetical protein
MSKDEPEIRRKKARRYVAWCNKAAHEAPWVDRDMSTHGGIFIALELAEQAYQGTAFPTSRAYPRWTYIRRSGSHGSTTKLARRKTA